MAPLGTLHHPRLYALADALGVSRAHALGILEALHHFADAWGPDRDITYVPIPFLCTSIGYDGDPTELMAALIKTAWVVRQGGSSRLRDWESDQC